MDQTARGKAGKEMRIVIAFLLIGFYICEITGRPLSYPDAANMTDGEILRQADRMQIKELKAWADSLYFPSGSKSPLRQKSEIVYRALMKRSAAPLTKEEEKILAAGYSNFATYLIFDKNDPVQAYPLLLRSFELMDKYKDDGLLIVGAYTNMAHIYANFHDTKRALKYLEDGFHHALKSNSPQRGGIIYSHLILMAWESEKLHDIKGEMKEFPQLEELKGGVLYDYNIRQTEAIEAYLDGKYPDAIRLLEESLKYLDPDFDKDIYEAMTLLMMADIYIYDKRPEKAKEAIDRVEKILEGYGELNGNEFFCRVKSDYYKAIGRKDLSKECEFDMYVMRDSLYSSRNMTTISDLEQELITTKFNAELREAKLHQELLEEKTKRQTYVITIIAVTAIIIILLLLKLVLNERKLNQARYDLILKDIDKSPEIKEPDKLTDDGGEKKENTPTDGKEDEEREQLHSSFVKICEFMETSRKIYDPGFSIEELSSILGIPVKQISRAVNLNSSKNFSNFMSDYRIREACRIMLNSPASQRPTIESVAESVGYRSRSHFSRTFKTVTGLTTTEFLRQKQQRP